MGCWAAWGRPLEGRMERPNGPVHARGAEVAKHPTGVYLQVSWVRGEQASPFFFYRKKKVAKPLRAKRCPFGAVALRDAAAAAEMRPPEGCGGISPVLRAKSLATLGCAPKRACGRSATGDQGAALTPSPSGTWATPSPLKRAAPNFRPYGSVCGATGCAWSLGLVGVTPIQSVKGRGIVLPCAR